MKRYAQNEELIDSLKDAINRKEPLQISEWLRRFACTDRNSLYRIVRKFHLEAAISTVRVSRGLRSAMMAAAKESCPKPAKQWAEEFGVQLKSVYEMSSRFRLSAAIAPAMEYKKVDAKLESDENGIRYRIGKRAFLVTGLTDRPLREVRIPAVRDSKGRVVVPGFIVIEAA